MKPAVLIALLLCFLMTSGLTSIAAGEAAAGIYGKIYEATRVMKADGEIPVQDLEEYTWTADPADVVITDTEIDLDERSLKSYTWDIPAGKTYETQIFYATKGERIGISINPVSYTHLDVYKRQEYIRGSSLFMRHSSQYSTQRSFLFTPFRRSSLRM